MLEAQSFRMHSSTTERTVCYVQPSRQVHRRVQARDRDYIISTGRPITECCAELGLNSKTVNKWVQNRRRELAGGPDPKAEDRELREAKRRIRELEMENAFLKKAAAFFAKSQA